MNYKKSKLIALIIFPFGIGYLLSFFLRNTNAILAPELSITFNLNATEIGFLTSVFFFSGAVQYIPLAILLDKYGPKKIFIGEIILAIFGCLLTSYAENFTMLVIGRALLGFGIGSCLTTAFKSVTVWFPNDFWATANGMILFSGALGAILSTKPLQYFLLQNQWRELFFIGFIVSIILLIFVIFFMPDNTEKSLTQNQSNAYVYKQIITNKIFYTIAPVSALGLASFFSIQGLWANGWMSDVANLSQTEVGNRLLAMAIAMSIGTIGNGAIVDQLAKRGINRAKYLSIGLFLLFFSHFSLAINIDPQAYWPWIIMGLTGNIGVLVHPILNRTYPPGYAARSISTIAVSTFLMVFLIQFGIGFILDIWGPNEIGNYPKIAYNYAFGILVVLEVLLLSWMLMNIKKLDING
tara:strand:+ start:55562 stop:56791 length:1230 start_codon:yes stop_codon:yes gene_type:complete